MYRHIPVDFFHAIVLSYMGRKGEANMRLFSRQEDPVFTQGAHDSPVNLRHRNNKKREAIIETWKAPIWPKLSKILFISMIVLSAAMLLVEVKSAMLSSPFDVHHFLKNISTTLLWVWGIYTVFLTACCLAGSRVNRAAYYKRKADSGIVDSTDEEKARSRRAVDRLNAAYNLYMQVAVIGLTATLLMYLLARLI